MSIGSNDANCWINSTLVTPTSTFSISGWFLILNINVTTFPVLIHLSRANADGLFLLSDGNGTSFYGGNQGLATTSTGIDTAVVGEWVYGGISVNGGSIMFYISRQLGTSAVASITVASSNVVDCTLEADDAGSFRAGTLVDHVRTWNVALSQAEFDAERSSPTPVKTAGLLTDSALPNTSTLDVWTLVGTVVSGTDSPYLVYPPVTPSVTYLTA